MERAPTPAAAASAKEGQHGTTPTQLADPQPMPLKPLSVNTGRGCAAVSRATLESQGSAYNCACGAGGEGGGCGTCTDCGASSSSLRFQVGTGDRQCKWSVRLWAFVTAPTNRSPNIR